MDTNHTDMKEQEMLSNIITERALFLDLLTRPSFSWGNDEPISLEDKLKNSARLQATDQLNSLQASLNLEVGDVLQKVESKIQTWDGSISGYSGSTSLNVLLATLSEQYETIQLNRDGRSPDETPTQKEITQEKTVSTILYETKAAIKRKAAAQTKLEKIKTDALKDKIERLKNIPNSEYNNEFNYLVCKKLDELESTNAQLPDNVSRLWFAESFVRKELLNQINLVDYLTNKITDQKEKQLKRFLKKGIEKLGMNDKAIRFAAILFEIEEAKTDDVWQMNKFEDIIVRGLNGEPINLITMLCCINSFDNNGNYTLVPDLDAYLKNPKLEPVPLIIDELVKTKMFFEYFGIDTNLTFYIADTDYTEVGQFGEVTEDNLENLKKYIDNVQNYVSNNLRVLAAPISEITKNDSVYSKSKQRIGQNIDEMLAAQVTDFSREWYQKFEDAFEKVSESQDKRGLWPKNEVRKRSLQITKNFWKVNGAQGARFGALGTNTVMISTERRERDQNYVIDKDTRANFPPVLYLLKAAELWNRKLTGKAA